MSATTYMTAAKKYLTQFGIMTPECFQELVVKLNYNHVPCLKAFVSKCLGIGIVAGSAMVKLPQVFKLMGSGSAEGITFIGTLLELLAVTANFAYSYSQNYPFSAYGESVFLSLQTSLIALLVLWFNGRSLMAVLFSIIYGAIIFAAVQPGMIPYDVLWYGQAANIPMVVIGKLMQVFTNLNNGHTGQLSAITVFLLAAGALARIFTSIQETGDKIVIITFIASSAVNVILALQVIWYWKKTNEVLSKKGGKSSAKQQGGGKKNKPKKA